MVYNERVCGKQTRYSLPPKDGGGYSRSDILAWAKIRYKRGCLKSWLLFRHPRELKIESLYINDLIFNIAKKPKGTVQKLKFLDSPFDERAAISAAENKP